VAGGTDSQKSATTRNQGREAETPVVVAVAASELAKALDAAESKATTLAVVDTASHTQPDAVRVESLVDLVVIPVRPTAFDLAAVTATVAMVKAPDVKAVLVLSPCP
jgi:chromosome partitioning protein